METDIQVMGLVAKLVGKVHDSFANHFSTRF